MSVPPDIKAEILKAYEANPKRFSPFKVAKQVGATLGQVLSVVDEHKTADVTYEGQLKRPSLNRYVVASRRATDAGWNNSDPEIVKARAAYEAGTHDMVTYREGMWLHLLSIPLSRRSKPRPGFFTGRSFT